jgi:hypothetical protein
VRPRNRHAPSLRVLREESLARMHRRRLKISHPMGSHPTLGSQNSSSGALRSRGGSRTSILVRCNHHRVSGRTGTRRPTCFVLRASCFARDAGPSHHDPARSEYDTDGDSWTPQRGGRSLVVGLHRGSTSVLQPIRHDSKSVNSGAHACASADFADRPGARGW